MPHRRDCDALLGSLGVSERLHFGRPLRDHLVGCHDLLVRWGAPPVTCLAGLFHSVYGTATFRDVTLGLSDRPRVCELIGAGAEQVAHFFCFGDRRRLMLDNHWPPYVWTDYRDATQVKLGEDVFRSLVLIETANFVEQLPFIDVVPDVVIDDMEWRIAAQGRWLSPPILKDLAAALSVRRSTGEGL